MRFLLFNDRGWVLRDSVPPTSLSEQVASEGPLSAEAARAVLAAALETLSFVHGQGVLHGDIKPSNLFTDREGRFLLADGLGLPFDERPPTDAQVLPATVDRKSVAPECDRPDQPIGPRADLYALGYSVLELLLGERGFADLEHTILPDKTAWVDWHRSNTPLPPVAELVPGMPKCLAAFIDRLVSKDPSRRFVSASDALEALRPTPQRADAPRRVSWGRTIAAGMLLVGVTVLSLWLAGALHWKQPPENGPSGAESQHQVQQTAKERDDAKADLAKALKDLDAAKAKLPKALEGRTVALSDLDKVPIHLIVSPPDAAVTIDGKPYKHDGGGNLEWKLRQDATALLKVEAPGYLSVERPYLFRDLKGAGFRVAIQLRRYLTFHPGVGQVTINDEVVLADKEGRVELKPTPSGRYHIVGKASSDDYEALDKVFSETELHGLNFHLDFQRVAVGAVTSPVKHRAEVVAVALTPDGREALSLSLNRELRRWDIANPKLLTSIELKVGRIRRAKFSRDGSRVLVAVEKELTLHDTSTGEIRQRFAWPKGQLSFPPKDLTGVSISPDGQQILAVHLHGQLLVWSTETGNLLRDLGEKAALANLSGLTGAAFSPDGRVVAVGTQKDGVRLLEVEGGKEVGQLSVEDAVVKFVGFSPGGSRILVGTDDDVVSIHDAGSRKLLQRFEHHESGGVDLAAFSPDGRHVLSGDISGKLRLLDVKTGKEDVAKIKEPRDLLLLLGDHSELFFSADGRMAVLSAGSSVHLRKIPVSGSGIGIRLLTVPPGEFLMGSPAGDPDKQPDELPQHKVRITKGMLVSATEVTVGQFRQFVRDTGYKIGSKRDGQGGSATVTDLWGISAQHQATAPWMLALRATWCSKEDRSWDRPGWTQGEDHPVVYVSREDAVAFCRWLSTKEGRRYRLPTEAEWEYVARATTTKRFGSSDDVGVLRGYANTADFAFQTTACPLGKTGTAAIIGSAVWGWAGSRHTVADGCFAGWVTTAPTSARKPPFPWDDGYPFTAPVGSFLPNPWGFHDMQGNVWEWCSDRYDKEFYKRWTTDSPARDPTGPPVGDECVVRGGSWYNQDRSVFRLAYRRHSRPTERFRDVGFRVVCDLDELAQRKDKESLAIPKNKPKEKNSSGMSWWTWLGWWLRWW